jgi:hypothetical protein
LFIEKKLLVQDIYGPECKGSMTRITESLVKANPAAAAWKACLRLSENPCDADGSLASSLLHAGRGARSRGARRGGGFSSFLTNLTREGW